MSRTVTLRHTFIASLITIGSILLLQACRGGGGGGGGAPPVSSPPNNVPRFAYMVNQSDNTVSMYTVNATTGQLRHNGYVATGSSPYSVSVDPAGRFAYVTNQGSGDISAYTINTNGTLAQVNCGGGGVCNGANFVAGTSPQSVIVDPTGKFAYIANQLSNNISAYTIDSTTGALTPVPGSPFPSGPTPISVTVDPSGRFAYVVNSSAGVGGNSISAYTINTTSGVLTEIDQNGGAAGTTVATGTTPISVSVDPTGKFVYVANSNSNDVSVYTINLGTGVLAGALTQVNCGGGAGCSASGVNFAAGTNPQSIAIDPSGRFAYVANINSQNVSTYSINTITGALTSVGLATGTGVAPTSVMVDPSGKFAYVANFGSNNVSAYSINAVTGALAALPPVTGRNGPTTMAMTRGTNAVTYTPKFAYVANRGSDSISAFTISTGTGALTVINCGGGIGCDGADFLAGQSPHSVAADPAGRFVYTANAASNDVSAFAVHPVTGVLTRIDCGGGAGCNGANFAAGTFAVSVAVDPTARFVFVANQTSHDLSAYSINASTGALTRITCGGGAGCNGDNFQTGTTPFNLSVDPAGRFVYVPNFTSNDVTAFSINPTSGSLTRIACGGGVGCNGDNFQAGVNPVTVTVDPSGMFSYVTNGFDGPGGNSVSGYRINLTTGALVSTGAALAAGTRPRTIGIEPTGKFAYVANNVINSVSGFTLNTTTGALTGLTDVDGGTAGDQASIATGATPFHIAFDPSGRFAYVPNSASNPNTVSAYSLNVTTGALTSLGTFSTGGGPGGGPESVTTTGTIQ